MKPKKLRFSEKIPHPEYLKVRFKWKKALLMILAGIAAYAVLKVLLGFGFQIAWIAYELVAGIPLIAYIVVVRGRLGKIPTPEEIVSPMSEDEKLAFIEGEKEKRKRGRVCLFIAFPFLLALMMAFLSEFYLPMVLPEIFG